MIGKPEFALEIERDRLAERKSKDNEFSMECIAIVLPLRARYGNASANIPFGISNSNANAIAMQNHIPKRGRENDMYNESMPHHLLQPPQSVSKEVSKKLHIHKNITKANSHHHGNPSPPSSS